MHGNLILCTEVVLDPVDIRREVVIGAHMANENWIIALNGAALFLETEVGVQVIDDPGVVEGRILCSN